MYKKIPYVDFCRNIETIILNEQRDILIYERDIYQFKENYKWFRFRIVSRENYHKMMFDCRSIHNA